jgi:hypothetical protein
LYTFCWPYTVAQAIARKMPRTKTPLPFLLNIPMLPPMDVTWFYIDA